MPQGTSFAELLDANLGCTVVPPPAAPRAWNSRPLTAPIFGFDVRLETAPRAAVRQASAPVEAQVPVRLTRLERQSLDDAPTPDALRRAYRTLAHRYHPDRHQDRSASEREQLARLFAEATEHYRRLLTRRP
jgi:hypothetical protein